MNKHNCTTCGGRGWLTCCYASLLDHMQDIIPIQRCDDCERFSSDRAAALAAREDDYPSHVLVAMPSWGGADQWFAVPVEAWPELLPFAIRSAKLQDEREQR